MRFDSIHRLGITFLSTSPTVPERWYLDPTQEFGYRLDCWLSAAEIDPSHMPSPQPVWPKPGLEPPEPRFIPNLLSWWHLIVLLNNIARFPQVPRPPPSCTDGQIVWCNTLKLVKLDSACNAKFILTTTTTIIMNHDFGGRERARRTCPLINLQKPKSCKAAADLSGLWMPPETASWKLRN